MLDKFKKAYPFKNFANSSLVLTISLMSCSFFAPMGCIAQSSDYSPSSYIIQHLPHQNIGDRIDTISSKFIGLPYLKQATGEGPNAYENLPLYRFDGFNCTTYIETVWALAMAKNSSDFEKILKKIRYRNSHINFIDRLHFVTLDWLPVHYNARLAEDITQRVAQEIVNTKVLETEINKLAWYQKVHPSQVELFQKEYPNYKPEIAKISYFDIKEIASLNAEQKVLFMSRIPAGALINWVRIDWPIKNMIGTDLDVSHQSFAVWKNGKLFLRHASLNLKKVDDEDFMSYLDHYQNHKTLKGFNVVALKQ
jgi:hypothetical protein